MIASASDRTEVRASTVETRPDPPRSRTRGLKVLHFLPLMRLQMGGPVRAVIDLAESMAARGHEVDVAACDYADCPAHWVRDGAGSDTPRLVRYVPGSLPGPLFTPHQLLRFSRMLERYDAVHFHSIWRPSILQLAPAAERAGSPYIVSARGMLDEWPMEQKRLKKRIYLAMGGSKVLARAGWVHCTAAAEERQAKRWIGNGRAIVIPNFMSLRPFVDPPRPEVALRALDIPDDGVPMVLFLSRVVHNKGPDILIRAASILAARGVLFRVVVAGDGDPKYVADMKALAAGLGLADRVRFVGMVGGELKLSLLSAATVMALPTCQENFGFVFFEALACGTPVLTSNLVDTAAELEAGGGTLLADLSDEAFAERLRDLLSDRERARSRGALGRRWVFKYLSPEPLLKRFESLYQTAGERRFRNPEPTAACAW